MKDYAVQNNTLSNPVTWGDMRITIPVLSAWVVIAAFITLASGA